MHFLPTALRDLAWICRITSNLLQKWKDYQFYIKPWA